MMSWSMRAWRMSSSIFRVSGIRPAAVGWLALIWATAWRTDLPGATNAAASSSPAQVLFQIGLADGQHVRQWHVHGLAHRQHPPVQLGADGEFRASFAGPGAGRQRRSPQRRRNARAALNSAATSGATAAH